MTPRTVLLLAAVPLVAALTAFGALAWGLESHGGPQADDPAVVAAHRDGQARLAATVDGLLAVVPGEVLDRRASGECRRGSRAVGGIGVDDGFRLRCEALAITHVRAGGVDRFDADAAALHDRLVAGGWAPAQRALPQLVAELQAPAPQHSDSGLDGRRGPADLAAANYVGPDGTELSVLLAERDERPAAPVDDGGARGWQTADRLGADEYGVVLRLSAVTVEA